MKYWKKTLRDIKSDDDWDYNNEIFTYLDNRVTLFQYLERLFSESNPNKATKFDDGQAELAKTTVSTILFSILFVLSSNSNIENVKIISISRCDLEILIRQSDEHRIRVEQMWRTDHLTYPPHRETPDRMVLLPNLLRVRCCSDSKNGSENDRGWSQPVGSVSSVSVSKSPRIAVSTFPSWTRLELGHSDGNQTRARNQMSDTLCSQ
jgi:hypothetical protein